MNPTLRMRCTVSSSRETVLELLYLAPWALGPGRAQQVGFPAGTRRRAWEPGDPALQPKLRPQSLGCSPSLTACPGLGFPLLLFPSHSAWGV